MAVITIKASEVREDDVLDVAGQGQTVKCRDSFSRGETVSFKGGGYVIFGKSDTLNVQRVTVDEKVESAVNEALTSAFLDKGWYCDDDPEAREDASEIALKVREVLTEKFNITEK